MDTNEKIQLDDITLDDVLGDGVETVAIDEIAPAQEDEKKIESPEENKLDEKIKANLETGVVYKYGLTDKEINQKAEEKTNQIFLRINDLYYSDMLKKVNEKLRSDINIKTAKINTKSGLAAIREDLSDKEIQRINEIDDHINDMAEYHPEPNEKKRA